MNILFVAHYDGLYGSIRSLLSLLDGLQEYPLKPFVIVPRQGGFTQALSARQVPYATAQVPYWVTTNRVSFDKQIRVIQDIFRSAKAIRQWVREWKIDLIYTNTFVSPVGRLAAWMEGIPHIWHIREFGDLDFLYQYTFPKMISQWLIKSSDAVICHAKIVQDHHFKPGTKRIHLVYNGSATQKQYDAFKTRKNEIQRQDTTYTFTMLSSITPAKGQETAIHAIAELYKRGLPVRLVIAGSGKESDVAQCTQLVEALGIAHVVEFKGFVDDPYELYFTSDCLLVCSDYEALSRAALEAMSACLPVIGKNSGGTPEIIEHENTGLLYNTFDELVAAMIRMVENPEWGRQLGLAGWKSAKERFNVEDYADKVYKIIQSVSKAG